jgi:hypothetical protein
MLYSCYKPASADQNGLAVGRDVGAVGDLDQRPVQAAVADAPAAAELDTVAVPGLTMVPPSLTDFPGPSRWLLVVVSYEQTPARIVSAFANRKDPRSWSA